GGCCVDGVCQPVVLAYLTRGEATALALDGGDVWWASPIRKIAKSGGALVTLADSNSNSEIWGIAVDQSRVYWTSAYDGLFAIDRSGGPTLARGTGGSRVGVDATQVFTAWEGVWKVPKSGGPPVALATVGDEGIAIDDDFVYFTTWAPGGVSRVAKTG